MMLVLPTIISIATLAAALPTRVAVRRSPAPDVPVGSTLSPPSGQTAYNSSVEMVHYTRGICGQGQELYGFSGDIQSIINSGAAADPSGRINASFTNPTDKTKEDEPYGPGLYVRSALWPAIKDATNRTHLSSMVNGAVVAAICGPSDPLEPRAGLQFVAYPGPGFAGGDYLHKRIRNSFARQLSGNCLRNDAHYIPVAPSSESNDPDTMDTMVIPDPLSNRFTVHLLGYPRLSEADWEASKYFPNGSYSTFLLPLVQRTMNLGDQQKGVYGLMLSNATSTPSLRPQDKITIQNASSTFFDDRPRFFPPWKLPNSCPVLNEIY